MKRIPFFMYYQIALNLILVLIFFGFGGGNFRKIVLEKGKQLSGTHQHFGNDKKQSERIEFRLKYLKKLQISIIIAFSE